MRWYVTESAPPMASYSRACLLPCHFNTEKLKFISGQFDVQNDMIIRTEESRKIGGKFLDSADGGSREECLRFCCETAQCDVFVYDECNAQNDLCSRTCFLFQCGPAQDFRCKFTKHANYTSAVLAKTAMPSTVPTRAALSQHEMELKNLKSKLPNGNESPNGVVGNANAATTTTTKRTHNIFLLSSDRTLLNLIAISFQPLPCPRKIRQMYAVDFNFNAIPVNVLPCTMHAIRFRSAKMAVTKGRR